ncbi:VOC family protein [Nonomuraea sp. B19D2]|uniref:VOC family protein n=1 Tax=Nonomuraea sp. B19D2 TaxID=3159561 RepID=UPI0032DBA55E
MVGVRSALGSCIARRRPYLIGHRARWQHVAMARIHDIVLDCRHPASLARFWAQALEGYEVAPYDQAELERLRSNGIDDPEDDPSVLVEAGPGVRPRFFFTLVPEPKAVKNRLHLDLTADDTEAEVRRLVGLGARVLAERDAWVTMADPEGNEFCVMR